MASLKQRILIINKSYQKRLFVRLEGVSAEKKKGEEKNQSKGIKRYLRVSARAFWGTKDAEKRAQLGWTQSRGGLQLCERLNGAAKCKFAALNKRTHTCVGVCMAVCVFVSVCASLRAF